MTRLMSPQNRFHSLFSFDAKENILPKGENDA